MNDEIAEVWLEIAGAGTGNKEAPLLVCNFYREQSLVRGSRSMPGSERYAEQKKRLEYLASKTRDIVNNEGKDTIIGGDLNAELGNEIRPPDNLGRILNQELVLEAGMNMIVKEPTHLI